MSLSDWFTAFGLFVAVYALFATEERRILVLKLNKADPYIFLTASFGTLVFIKYNDLYYRFSYLKGFDVSWGINSSNWALILFLSAAIYYAVKLYRIPSKLPSPDFISTYRQHESAEYPLKYHYLISEIFDTIDGWIDRYNEDGNFKTDSSLFSFFPTCMRWCLKELIKGYELGVIPEDFVLRIYHYRVMLTYYKHDLKEELATEIENKCILEIPPNLLEDILTYSLNESFALSFSDFKATKFRHPGSNPHEIIIIKRLYDLLTENNLL